MRNRTRRLAIHFVVLTAFWLSVRAQETPIGSRWWPSEWGASDQRGAANRITPAKVLEATRLITQGRVYSLGRLYQEEMPLSGRRHFKLTIPAPASPIGENRIVGHDEMVCGEIGQVGTQLDGLGHVGVQMADDAYFYNGVKRSEMADPYGLRRLGIENAGVFFTRGVLIDVAGYKQVDRLQPGYVITVADLEETLKKEGVKIGVGDVVLIRTGHGKLWMNDNVQYSADEPGIGLAAAKWLTEKKIVMTGADSWAVEAVPGENPKRPFEVHQWMLVRNGIYNLENLDLEALAADKVYEFAFIFAPLRLKGASGSPGNPVAVR